MTESIDRPVSVIGMGNMGSAVARTLLDRGHPTTVWNRTADKAEALADAGASIASSAAKAVAASPVTILSLLDNTAMEDVLDAVGDSAAGRTLVSLTSGSPAQARANGSWASGHGAAYVDGKVMGDPPDVGTPRVSLAFSGDRDTYASVEPVLRELGSVAYHGEDPGFAAVEFNAQVAVGYEFLIGFLHTLDLVETEGMDLEAFSERVAGSLSGYAGLVRMMATAIKSRSYGPDLGSLDVQAALMDDLIEHRESAGVESVRMREVKSLMDRRVAQGHGDQGFSSLYELFRLRA
ncbi:3-hydroxyisobutyrate dehydrogenase-like beta-hydroxyacid dehydrogenase [Nocardioides luteus]|uniref:3-hydroxyisobutyrate dehydrogenase n=1 Tax=Nocardioides luteus TaxID=1844 RepID=A0ABQ5T1F8_9ACTN|nr:NAD(P)-binding domain-containing protein [Nocardioides luteus]MDR7310270.1 3-hydroxyisobutyrate dehydrogenase-like beta-hydroxyacid dehydrogenase [Nocardioides luteus]GGR53794.1 3-hydroxyisobutyrate dehydrogenase [Nocardioides luteus]GLJ69951.1 3-hydroxyisobutyrate dehydrogenase [Nocardioides luteus]